jgi:hypothetical protein
MARDKFHIEFYIGFMLLVTITAFVYGAQLSSSISRTPDCGEEAF